MTTNGGNPREEEQRAIALHNLNLSKDKLLRFLQDALDRFRCVGDWRDHFSDREMKEWIEDWRDL